MNGKRYINIATEHFVIVQQPTVKDYNIINKQTYKTVVFKKCEDKFSNVVSNTKSTKTSNSNK